MEKHQKGEKIEVIYLQKSILVQVFHILIESIFVVQRDYLKHHILDSETILINDLKPILLVKILKKIEK